jgi:hypothetical protein
MAAQSAQSTEVVEHDSVERWEGNLVPVLQRGKQEPLSRTVFEGFQGAQLGVYKPDMCNKASNRFRFQKRKAPP